MKKLIVFGGTGATGQQVIKQALEKGYEVTAVVRTPSALAIADPQLSIVKGDVLQPVTFEKLITAGHTVISCLGSGRSTAPTTIYSAGIENMIAAMEKAGATRLLCITAGALYATKEMGWLVRTLTTVVLQRILKNPYADMRRMETRVQTSNLQWTIVRPARLTNKPFTGKYRTAVNKPMVRPGSISRADVAHFMLNNIENTKTFKTIVEQSY